MTWIALSATIVGFRRKISRIWRLKRFLLCALPYFFETEMPSLELRDFLIKRRKKGPVLSWPLLVTSRNSRDFKSFCDFLSCNKLTSPDSATSINNFSTICGLHACTETELVFTTTT